MAGVQGSALAIAVSQRRAASARSRARMLTPDGDARGAGGDPGADGEAVQRQLLLPRAARARSPSARLPGGRRSRRTTRSSASTRRHRRRRPARAPFSAEAADVLAEFDAAGRELPLRPARRPICWRGCARWGAKILSSATTVDEARWLEARGVDAIIAQGLEAGGHRGMFLSDDLDHAGRHARAGAADRRRGEGAGDRRGRHRRRARRRGRDGARRRRRPGGNGLPALPEATTSPRAPRRAAERRRARHRAHQRASPAGRRAIVNRLMRELGPMTPPPRPSRSPRRPSRRCARRAESRGSGDFSPLWAGQNASGCRPAPAATITRELARGFLASS